ncbi:MAG: hypothetical protein LM558_01225 [Thermosphaera sp.]|nr:hypothetical protein [Thermosphaera sp.]
MSVVAVRAVLPIVLLTVVFAITLGVVYYVKAQLNPAGLQWPSAFDTALSTLTSFGTLVVIVALATLVIFVLLNVLDGRVAGRFITLGAPDMGTPVLVYMPVVSPLEALKILAETAVRAVRGRARAGVVGGLLVLISIAVLVLVIGIAIAVGSQVITAFNQTTGSIPKPVGTLLTTISNFANIIVLVTLAAVIILILLSAFGGIARGGR